MKEPDAAAPKPAPARKKTRTGKARIKSQSAPGTPMSQVVSTPTTTRKEQIVFLKEPFKGTLNTHDIMHSPVEKTIRMLEKIIAGERLFTM
jgi:hypothetical protein